MILLFIQWKKKKKPNMLKLKRAKRAIQTGIYSHFVSPPNCYSPAAF